MSKIDFKKSLKHLYRPSTKNFEIVDVPPMEYLLIDGWGAPGSPTYTAAVEALYGVAYKVKFTSKNELDYDYVVPPLEGLWWADDMGDFVADNKDNWKWTMMIMQPEVITFDIVGAAMANVIKQKGLTAVGQMRFETYEEGLCVQIMHIGPYSEEGPTLAKMHHEFIPENGYEMTGKDHEIYISDPRRVAPEKMKTVLRQPVAKAA